MIYLARPAEKPSRWSCGRIVAATVASLVLHLLAMSVALAPVAPPDPARQALNVRMLDAMPLPPHAEPTMTPPPAASATNVTARKAPAPLPGRPTRETTRSAALRLSLASPDAPELVEQRPDAPPAPPTEPAPFVAERLAADYRNNPEPTYPVMSRRLGEQGSVVLSVRVSTRGDVLSIEVNRSSGHTRLDDAAIAAVERWRFVPARQGDAAVESTVLVPLRFSLGK